MEITVNYCSNLLKGQTPENLRQPVLQGQSFIDEYIPAPALLASVTTASVSDLISHALQPGRNFLLSLNKQLHHILNYVLILVIKEGSGQP